MISTSAPHYPVCTISNPGRVRKKNEDRLKVTSYRLSTLDQTPAILAIMADGIGGHLAGDIAAEMAINSITSRIGRSLGADRPKTLVKAITTASREIYSHGLKNPARLGLGTTIACTLMVGERLYTASVGDSRIYLLRGKRILQLSEDHTWLREMLDRHLITLEQAANHPNRHVIRRYLGSPNPPEVDLRMRLSMTESDYVSLQNQGTSLAPGDSLLLCTDGLTDLVNDSEIYSTLRKNEMDRGLDELVELALDRGGIDNISIILIQVPE
jgi:serine/threonine protein phosphatase PrpC